ncbi:MAG: hypothetical protein GY854_00975 [Deltaproteobacteria bacterium]|nr:hypothetical protein [Deltaproteobacteria bacterium]
MMSLISVFLCAAAILSTAGTAHADEASNLMLLVEPRKDSVRGLEELRVALEAHLGTSDTIVRLHVVRAIPRRPSSQEKKARKWAAEEGANAVVWIDVPRQTMSLVYTDADGNERKLQRQFGCISRDVGECGDAIASAVSSAISSWIGRETQVKEPPPAPPAEDNELSPIAIEDVTWEEPDPLAGFFFDTGYGFAFFKGTGTVAHGPHFGIGAVWKGHFKTEVSVDFALPIRSKKVENIPQMEIYRWPIRITAGGVLPLRRWSFGLSGGFVIELNNYRMVTEDRSKKGVEEVRSGFTAALSARFKILSWLAVWLNGGLDIFASEVVYLAQDELDAQFELFHFSVVQGNLALGVAFEWKAEI